MARLLYELCGADETQLFSPHCWKARMALNHKGLDFETVPTPFTKVATMEGGTSRRIPVLRDGDTVVEESYEIALYLDRQYPDAPGLFDGNEELTKFVIQWSQATIHPEVVKLCLMDIHDALAPADQEHFRRTREPLFKTTLEEFDAKFPKDNKGLNRALVPLENRLKEADYLGGEKPIFADYVVFGPLQWLRTVHKGGVMTDLPGVRTWFERLLDMYEGDARGVKAAA